MGFGSIIGYRWGLIAVMLFGMIEVGYGQRARMYADGYGTETGGILGNSSVSNPHRVVGANAGNEPVLLSASGLGGNAKLQVKFLRFGQNMPSGIVIRVMVENTSDLNITAQQNTTGSIEVGGSEVGFSPPLTSGNIITLTPNQTFNAISLRVNAGTLGAERVRNVYHAYIEPYTLPLTLKNTSFTSCGPIGISDILNFATPDLLDYEIINTTTNLPVESGQFVTISGNYHIRMTDPGSTSDPAKVSASFNVTINPVPEIELSETYIRVPINTIHPFPAVSCAGCGEPAWKDALENTQTQIPARSIPGITVYTVSVSNDNCVAQKQIIVDVYDPEQECSQKERKYATILGETLNVSNANGARDGDPSTYSTLTSIVVLGLGGANQTIRWNDTVPIGTTVYIKMGVGAGLLGLANTVSIQQKNGSSNVGSSMTVSGGLIELLVGDNDIIYSFTTSSTINGITLSMGGLLAVGLTAKLYDAWYEVPSATCPTKDVIDILSGSEEILKGVLNAASVTVNVQNPYNAIDDDETTAAVMNSGVGVLAYAKLDVLFSSMSQPGDSVFIKVQSGVETINLLGGFVIQRYIGATPVGPPLDFGGTVLTLLKGSNGESIIFTVTTEPYDRISIRYGGTANVLGQLLIYDIKRKPYIYTYVGDNKEVNVCEGEGISVGLNQACLEYDWYESESGGNSLYTSAYREGESTNAPYVPSSIGIKTYYIQHRRNGCVFGPRMPLVVNMTPLPGKPHLTITDVIN